MGTLKRVKFEMPPDDEEPKVHMRSREGRLSPCSHRGSATLLSFLRRTDTYAPCSDRGAVARPRVPYRSNSMYIGTASISWPRDYSTIIPQRVRFVSFADFYKMCR
ncbi:unnamed protein product [Toxocara canis]|uniref:Uncharacterized protein n=1 Tax=Toxocara canis TaxID=6265 RepID=A0A183USB3_TOXCA|nr:unnamed protein product [Toxocara canis]